MHYFQVLKEIPIVLKIMDFRFKSVKITKIKIRNFQSSLYVQNTQLVLFRFFRNPFPAVFEILLRFSYINGFWGLEKSLPQNGAKFSKKKFFALKPKNITNLHPKTTHEPPIAI